GQKGKFVRPEAHAKVARLLTDYLSKSNEYKYSLQRPRKNHALDPTEDFLVNVKEGHCERFATALALMLRSCGIPTRLVVGFRGRVPLGAGHSVLPQSHSHPWVETMMVRHTLQVPAEHIPFLGGSMAGLGASIDSLGAHASLGSMARYIDSPRYWLARCPPP